MTAGEALAALVAEALAGLSELNGRYEGPPLQAAFPFATVEAGLETDWSHKSGLGREVRLTVILRDRGEPSRLRRLAGEAETAIAAAGAAAGGWRIVTLTFLRSRLFAEAERQWTAALDYRARMLSE
ncbi:MAG TPA: DUF3168 domain-containing protein [Allosphingosinicella sp.]|nr:DUF3168 domain-containing protein [Allosphingosinicella sp.]